MKRKTRQLEKRPLYLTTGGGGALTLCEARLWTLGGNFFAEHVASFEQINMQA